MSGLGTVIPLQTNFAGSDVIEAVLRDAIITSLLLHHSDSAAAVDAIVNGDFSSSTGWTFDTGASIAGGVLILNDVTVLTGAQKDCLVVGVEYDIEWTMLNRTNGGFRVKAGTATGSGRIVNGTFTDTLTCAGNTNFGVERASGTGTTYAEFDNITAVPTSGGSGTDWTLALYPGHSIDGPWASKPDFGPIRIGSLDFTASTVATAGSIGDLTLVVADGTKFAVGNRVLLAVGTAKQQIREITNIATNTLTFSERLTRAVAVDDTVFTIQSVKVDIPQIVAPFYKVQLVNGGTGGTDAFVLAHGNVIRGVQLT